MIRGIEAILLSSEDAPALAKFYEEIVGLPIKEEYEVGTGETYFEMKIGEGSALYINSHSEVKGKTKEPARVMINFEVDNIEKESERIEKAGVKNIQKVYHIEGYGFVSTWEDPDGNYFQLVQVRPSK
jgi:predicted enzyme related to lactoylglutathione lyase